MSMLVSIGSPDEVLCTDSECAMYVDLSVARLVVACQSSVLVPVAVLDLMTY